MIVCFATEREVLVVDTEGASRNIKIVPRNLAEVESRPQLYNGSLFDNFHLKLRTALEIELNVQESFL